MRVLFVSSEIFPLAKTGGLADVSAALPRALLELGIDIRLLMPGYPKALRLLRDREAVATIPDFFGGGTGRLIAGKLPGSGLPTFLIDAPHLYDRPGGPYLDEAGREWPDNAVRFAMLSRTAAWCADEGFGEAWRPDLVHANDWHTGLVPLWLREARIPTLFTIHNLAFQGVFPADTLDRLGLTRDLLNPSALEFYGRISFLKAGIRYSDHMTTVSPTYAREILTPEFGCGLDGLLRERAAHLTGILNGVDREVWDPARDPHLPMPYGPADLSGKRLAKAAIQRELGLDEDAEAPLVAFVSRLTRQKMADLVLDAADFIAEEGGQFALIGDGEKDLEALFEARAAARPGRIAAHIGYREGLAHRLYAGADIMLAPARFEPCGLTPIYAMRYGAVPVVRAIGGMADTVVPATPRNLQAGAANGFSFADETAAALVAALADAFAAYREPVTWRKLQRCGMRRDWSWEAGSAQAYLSLYREIAGAGEATAPTPAPEAAYAAELVRPVSAA